MISEMYFLSSEYLSQTFSLLKAKSLESKETLGVLLVAMHSLLFMKRWVAMMLLNTF